MNPNVDENRMYSLGSISNRSSTSTRSLSDLSNGYTNEVVSVEGDWYAR